MAKRKDPADFWREYAQRIGEPVSAYALGRYIRGWDALEPPLWGLLIVSAGGFRFHHFPHENWLQAISRNAAGESAPTEKILFIPKDRLLGAELKIEKSWWKRLLVAQPPLLLIRCLTENRTETTLAAETEITAAAVAEHIKKLIKE